MKKYLWLLILLPLVVTAAPTNWESSWDTYPFPTASMTISCGVNGAAKSPVGTATAATGVVPFNVSMNPGDTIACVSQASLNGDVSPPSAEVTDRIPLALPAPVGRLRRVVP